MRLNEHERASNPSEPSLISPLYDPHNDSVYACGLEFYAGSQHTHCEAKIAPVFIARQHTDAGY